MFVMGFLKFLYYVFIWIPQNLCKLVFEFLCDLKDAKMYIFMSVCIILLILGTYNHVSLIIPRLGWGDTYSTEQFKDTRLYYLENHSPLFMNKTAGKATAVYVGVMKYKEETVVGPIFVPIIKIGALVPLFLVTDLAYCAIFGVYFLIVSFVIDIILLIIRKNREKAARIALDHSTSQYTPPEIQKIFEEHERKKNSIQ